MDIVSGFLGLCAATGAGTVTEVSAPGYSRQPIALSSPVNGVSVNTRPFDFGQLAIQPTAGRAVFDAPTGGNLLLVLPHVAPRIPSGGSTDRGPDGYLTAIFSPLAAYYAGDSFNGAFSAAAAVGICYDADEIIGWATTQPNAVSGVTVLPRGGQFLRVQASTLYAGVALTVLRGLAHA